MVRFALWAVVLGLLPAVTCAQTVRERFRGVIQAVSGQELTINTREGTEVTIILVEPVRIAAMRKIDLGAIHTGDYVGVAAGRGEHEKLVALEVLVFPEADRGSGEGFREWDLAPGSMMANATVSGEAETPSGRELTVSYKGGQQVILVPKDVPVVGFIPGDKADLKPGAAEFVPAARNADGRWSSSR